MADGVTPGPQTEIEQRLVKLLEELAATAAPTDGTAKPKERDGWTALVARLIMATRRLAQSQSSDVFFREAVQAALLLKRQDDDARRAAVTVIEEIERGASRSRPVRMTMVGVGIHLLVTVLLFTLCGWASLLVVVDKATEVFALSNGALQVSTNMMAACIFGSLGAMVSIIMRMGEFESLGARTNSFLMMTGALLPVVGATFAIVTYAMFASDLMSVTLGTTVITGSTANVAVAVVIGFISGFSERFTRGMIDKLDGASDAKGKKQ